MSEVLEQPVQSWTDAPWPDPQGSAPPGHREGTAWRQGLGLQAQLGPLPAVSGEARVNSLVSQQMRRADAMGRKRPSDAWGRKEETSS